MSPKLKPHDVAAETRRPSQVLFWDVTVSKQEVVLRPQNSRERCEGVKTFSPQPAIPSPVNLLDFSSPSTPDTHTPTQSQAASQHTRAPGHGMIRGFLLLPLFIFSKQSVSFSISSPSSFLQRETRPPTRNGTRKNHSTPEHQSTRRGVIRGSLLLSFIYLLRAKHHQRVHIMCFTKLACCSLESVKQGIINRCLPH